MQAIIMTPERPKLKSQIKDGRIKLQELPRGETRDAPFPKQQCNPIFCDLIIYPSSLHFDYALLPVSSALSVPQTNSWLTRNTCASQRNPSIWKVIYYPLSITTSNLLFSYDALPLTQACTSKSQWQKKSPNPIAYIAREKKTLQARPMTYHLHPCNTFSEEIRLTSQQRADGKQ